MAKYAGLAKCCEMATRSATDTGTRLVFTTWVVDTSAGVDQTAAGYHVCLDQLMQLLDTEAPQPFIDRDPTPYVKQYALILDL